MQIHHGYLEHPRASLNTMNATDPKATWANKIHQRHPGIPRFRVLTVTNSTPRDKSLLDACGQLQRGHGLFLFADESVLQKELLSPVWRSGRNALPSSLLN